MTKPSEMMCFALYETAHAVQQVYRPLLKDIGLTYPQYVVLMLLWDTATPLSVREIGETVHLESSTLTPLLKRLEAAGLVERSRDTKDERRVLINLTKAGIALQKQAAHIPTCFAESTGLNASEIDNLRDLILTLSSSLRQADNRS